MKVMMSKQVGSSEEQSSWMVRDRAYRRYPNINKQLLTNLYCVQGLSTVEIAKQLNVSRNLNGKHYGPYRRARWSITIGKPFVEGLKVFLEREGIILSPKCIQRKAGTGLIEVAHQDTIRTIAGRMYQYGTLWLQRKKDIFDRLG